jgi:hypothetical protein
VPTGCIEQIRQNAPSSIVLPKMFDAIGGSFAQNEENKMEVHQ